MPRVSIGLPVFNGENFLEKTLDSILTQTYQDFELIISDNASADNTPRICREYVAKDSRIRYYRNERNIGASNNFNCVFKLSSGEYFKWVAHDDVLAPDYLLKCVNVLDCDSSIVLCHSKTSCIDENGVLVSTYEFGKRISSEKTYERFGQLISFNHPIWAIFGVMRASALRMTPLMKNYIGSDTNLLAEIGLIGRIYIIPEYLFFQRIHPESYSSQIHDFSNNREQLDWWDPTRMSGSGTLARMKYIYNCFEFLRSIKRIPLRWSDRLFCYLQIGKWFFEEGWIIIGVEMKKAIFRQTRARR